MRQANLLLTVLACALLGAGCDSDSPTAPLLPDGPVEPVQLYASQSSGFDDQTRRVVRQQTEFETVWEDVVGQIMPPPDLPDVDFERFMVLVVASGEKPNGCYGISVSGASADGTDLTVQVTEAEPDATCGCTQAVVQPVEVVRVPRADEVFFQTLTEIACPA